MRNMAVNNYGIVTVKILISTNNKNIMGDTSLQAICELLTGGMWIYAVNDTLKDVIREGDLALVDQGMTSIPNTLDISH